MTPATAITDRTRDDFNGSSSRTPMVMLHNAMLRPTAPDQTSLLPALKVPASTPSIITSPKEVVKSNAEISTP